jgi:hypothetical protein
LTLKFFLRVKSFLGVKDSSWWRLFLVVGTIRGGKDYSWWLRLFLSEETFLAEKTLLCEVNPTW